MSLLLRTSKDVGERIRIRRSVQENRHYTVVGRLLVLLFALEEMDAPLPTHGMFQESKLHKFWKSVRNPFIERGERPAERILRQAVEQAADDDPVFQRESIDWMQTGPRLALSDDAADLLLIDPVAHPPDLNDARTKPPILREQRYRDRTSKAFDNFLVLKPVRQILYRPASAASFALVDVQPDHKGNPMAFLIDPLRSEGHLIGGRFLPPHIPEAHTPAQVYDRWQEMQQRMR